MPRDDDARALIAALAEADILLVRELELAGKLSSRFARDHVAILRGIGGRARADGSGSEDEAVPPAEAGNRHED